MAHYVKLGIAVIFSVAGLACLLTWPNRYGFMGFIVLFVLGSVISSRIFNRLATKTQIKQDLERRLEGERY